MKSYGQFCPIARGSEILAERWTPIILRNVLLGCRTFNEIAAGAPGLSRALLTKRLRELERADVITIHPKPDGHGSLYEPTPSGRELWPVLNALGDWAEQWMEISPRHADPDVVLWEWCQVLLRRDHLPDTRVVVRFDFQALGRRVVKAWLLIERREAEICGFDPGFGEDLVVTITNSVTFARWHLGLVDWGTALRSGGVQVTGPRDLRDALPTWNAGPQIHAWARAERKRPPGSAPAPPPGAAPARQSKPSPDDIEGRRSSVIPAFEGELITADDPGYDDARAAWNGAVDARPRYIARCLSPSDAAAALRFGHDRDLAITVRGGGRGAAACDDGLLIDLGPMKSITVDPARRTATVQAGVVWAELDATTQAFGLATTGATVSHAGVSGHTLSGGVGWLMRRHGSTVDNLVAAEVITGDGDRLAVSERERLRGLRGGPCAVVTSFTYRLHPVGPEVLAGPVLWALEDAPAVLRAYREYVASAPPEVATSVILRRAPPGPFLPVELHRRPVCQIGMVALAEPDEAGELLAPLRALGRPLLDLVKRRPYTGLQSMTDGTVPNGWHYSCRSTGLEQLDDAVIEMMVDHAGRARSLWSYAELFHGDIAHELTVNAVWLPHEPIGEAETAWARAFLTDLAPVATALGRQGRGG